MRLDDETYIKLCEGTKTAKMSRSEFVRMAIITVVEMMEKGEIEL